MLRSKSIVLVPCRTHLIDKRGVRHGVVCAHVMRNARRHKSRSESGVKLSSLLAWFGVVVNNEWRTSGVKIKEQACEKCEKNFSFILPIVAALQKRLYCQPRCWSRSVINHLTVAAGEEAFFGG